MKRELTLIFSILSFWGTKLELKRVCRVRCGMKQTRNQRTTISTRNQMEVQRTRCTTLRRNIGTVGEKLQERNVCSVGNRSVTEDVLSTTMCIAEQTLTKLISDFNDSEALTLNHFLLSNKNICLLYLPSAEELVDHQKLIRQTQAYENLTWDRFR